jgi:hypothetical protein
MKTKVRFHLGAGEHFGHWQVKHPDGRVEFFDPEKVDLHLMFCQLKNYRKTAEKIFNGENKTVCAWVNCDDVFVYEPGTLSDSLPGEAAPLFYNPRVAPFWRDLSGNDLDGTRYINIHTEGKNIFCRY